MHSAAKIEAFENVTTSSAEAAAARIMSCKLDKQH